MMSLIIGIQCTFSVNPLSLSLCLEPAGCCLINVASAGCDAAEGGQALGSLRHLLYLSALELSSLPLLLHDHPYPLALALLVYMLKLLAAFRELFSPPASLLHVPDKIIFHHNII